MMSSNGPAASGSGETPIGPVLDLEHMADLLDAMGAEAIAELIGEFKQSIQARLAGVMEAVEAEDVAVLGQRAHGMISAASPLGLMELALSAREVERLCFAKDAPSARHLARTLPALVERATRSLADWLSARSGRPGQS
ncbi:MAG: hypothetical protein FJX35_27475 [Alphaproteobacteria bacterium]|nr:hypothetical protein [Alphaproteobacteria bacterium]